MSAIAGIISFQKFYLNEESFIDIKESLLKRGKGFEFKKSNSYLMFNVKDSHQQFQKYIIETNTLIFNFDGRIDNRIDLINKFKLKVCLNDAELAMHLYSKLGIDSFNHIIGAFVLIVFDKLKKKITCSRDQLGIRPIYYSYDDNAFIYASEPRFIFKLKKIEKDVNNIKLKKFLIGSETDPSMTYYKNISKVPRGCIIEICNKLKSTTRYFEFKRDQSRFEKDTNLTETFFENFFKAIECQIPNEEKIGSALSGGLDSTSVTGMLMHINKSLNLNKRINSLSYRFVDLKESDKKRTDEMGYVNDALKMGDINPIIIDIENTNIIQDLLSAQSKFSEPCLHANRYLELEMINACKINGIKTIFTGYDGDCTISYGMENIQALLSQNKFIKAISLNNSVRNKVGLKNNTLKVILMYVILKRLPLAVHFFIKKLKGLNKFNENHKFLSKELTEHINYKQVLKDIREKQFNYEDSHQRLLNSQSFSNNFEVLDIDYSYNEIEERHPFCNHKFMQFCLDIPIELKLKEGMTRYILRESMKEIIPRTIYTRMTKSNLSPYFLYSFDSMKNDLFESLIDTTTAIKPMLNAKNLKIMYKKSNLTDNEKSYIVSYNCLNEWLKSN